jgi:uncharacterized integral membrane protein
VADRTVTFAPVATVWFRIVTLALLLVFVVAFAAVGVAFPPVVVVFAAVAFPSVVVVFAVVS